MSEPEEAGERPIRLHRYVWALVACWTVAIGVTLTWRLNEARNQAAGIAFSETRGAAGVSLPESSVWPAERAEMAHRIAVYGGMWILGLFGIGVLSRDLRRQFERRYQAERKLQEANELLEQRVADRTAELSEINRHLQSEIAERKQAERWLLESEQRFRGYFEQGLVGMAILSADRRLVEANHQLCKMLRYSERELVGKPWTELTHPEDLAAEDARLKQVIGGVTRGYAMEKRFLRKDGSVLCASLSVQCMRKEDRSIDCILALVQETTDRPRGGQQQGP